MCVCASVCACVCQVEQVCVCVRPCVRAHVYVRTCVRASMHACVFVKETTRSERLPARVQVYTPQHRSVDSSPTPPPPPPYPPQQRGLRASCELEGQAVNSVGGAGPPGAGEEVYVAPSTGLGCGGLGGCGGPGRRGDL